MSEHDSLQTQPGPENIRRIEDIEKAHAMAIASNRNESNIAALKKVAMAHMMNPDEELSPLKIVAVPVEDKWASDRDAHYAQLRDPAKRTIEARDWRSIAGRHRTAEYAIDMAKEERVEADRVAQIAADRHDALERV